MIINKTTEDIIRVLLNEKDKTLKLRELSSKAKVSLGMTVKIANALEASGHLQKTRGIRVINYEKLLKAWAYTVSVNENKKMEFLGAERPQYLIEKIARLLQGENYALTLFSATEIIAPYVAPNKVHLYVLGTRGREISVKFEREGIIPAEEGNVICYLADERLFYGSMDIRGIKVVSLPQLYVDLASYSGRGEEAAEHVLSIWRKKNV